VRSELEQGAPLGHPGLVPPEPVGGEFGGTAFADHRLDGVGLLDGVEVLAVEVLRQDRVQEGLAGVGHVLADERLQPVELDVAGGAVAAFAVGQDVVGGADVVGVIGPELEVGGAADGDDGLQLADPHAGAELGELLAGAEVGAGVERGRDDLVQPQPHQGGCAVPGNVFDLLAGERRERHLASHQEAPP
jgi:hypothetical protein